MDKVVCDFNGFKFFIYFDDVDDVYYCGVPFQDMPILCVGRTWQSVKEYVLTSINQCIGGRLNGESFERIAGMATALQRVEYDVHIAYSKGIIMHNIERGGFSINEIEASDLKKYAKTSVHEDEEVYQAIKRIREGVKKGTMPSSHLDLIQNVLSGAILKEEAMLKLDRIAEEICNDLEEGQVVALPDYLIARVKIVRLHVL